VDVTHWTTRVAQSFDVVGAAILVVGFVWSITLAIRTWLTAGGAEGYRRLRTTFGRTVLLGLEVLVAADLIRTVAVAPTLQNVLVLAIIVAIRTFLSFSLEVEIEGSLPWRRTTGRAPGRPPATPSHER
jgi:Predicted membrane protein